MREISGYSGLIGQENIVGELKKAAGAGRISHAYIIQGEKGSGKGLLAELFAMAIQCETHTGEPCMKCDSCKRAIRGNHPDIITVHHAKPDVIGVDEIRAQVVDDIVIKPFASLHKIYIIHDASGMTPQAQNALLKTLEEPPAYAVLILTAENADAFLPTIRSRCVMISMQPVSDRAVADYLIRDMNMSEPQAEIYAALARGNIGRASEIASSGEFAEILGASLAYLSRSKEASAKQRAEFIRKICTNKRDLTEYLDIFTLWFRDTLYLKATNEPDGLIFREEHRQIQKRGSVSSYEGIQNILNAIEKTRSRIAANVNPELAFELLLLTIEEN